MLEEEAPFAAYASVIRKLARLFRNLEEQGRFLSKEEEEEEKGGRRLVLAGMEGYGGGSRVYALCEMILEDLNNYCECMIPIGGSYFLFLYMDWYCDGSTDLTSLFGLQSRKSWTDTPFSSSSQTNQTRSTSNSSQPGLHHHQSTPGTSL